jgi:cysteine desulfurase
VARTYLDWNATTPPLAAVVDAMRDAALATWGNPASVHADGRAARARVEDARAAVAELAGGDPRDVLLTSGGTEANNLALRSFFAEAGGVLITSAVEHPSVVRVAEGLAREGRARLRWVRVHVGGAIDRDDLARACAETDERALVAVQAVNGETGVLQPVDDVIAIARARKGETRVHVDAVQAYGRVERLALEADTRSLAGHKIRGPKGLGALIARPGVKLHPVLLGGAQERGLRPGTVDPVAAAGLAVAARHARAAYAAYAALAPLRDALEAACVALGAAINGAAPRAPHVVNASFAGWNGAELVAALDLEGVSASAGSACSAGTIEPSPVIAAMAGDARARSAVRFSMGEETTRDDVERAIAALRRIAVRS